MKRLGIMGGTFDPIHYGHLVTAEAARDQFRLDKVVFVPSGIPPHKKDYMVTDASHRYLMTMLAVATNPFFEVSRVEIDRPGYSYAVDTVRHFCQLYGAETQFFFITGADAIMEILTWKNVDEMLTMTSFIAATRPGFSLAGDDVLNHIPPYARKRIELLEVPALAISSTDIRRRVSCHRSIKYLLPESVEQYIVQNGIYANSGVWEKGRNEK